MKRILALILSLAMLLPCFSYYTFAQTSTLHFDLSIDGKHEYYAHAGDKITVDFIVSNALSDEKFTITNLQNEIEFDQDFFEFSYDDVEYITTTSHVIADYSWGAKRVKLMAYNVSNGKAKEYNSNQLVARVTFKVKDGLADGTRGKLLNKAYEAADGIGDITYDVTYTNMTVIIGDPPKDIYTVTYKDGGEVIESDDSVVDGTSITIRAALTAAGEKFGGWKDEDGTVYQPGDSYTVSDNVTFNAVWLDKYTLSFQSNGGTSFDDVVDFDGTEIDLSDYEPVKTGYTFTGWFTDAELNDRVTEITLSKDTTVYAGWDINEYKVEFVTNGGSAVDAAEDVYGTVINLNDYVTSKTGYTFAGWFSDAELNDRVTEITLSKDTTVYAGWDINEYKVEFVTNGGTEVADIVKDFGSVVVLGDDWTTKTGYTFTGWFTDAELNDRVTEITLSKDTTVYAGWDINEYKVEFVTNGGSAVGAAEDVYGTVINLNDYVTTKTGYTFAGWYKDEDCTVRVTELTLAENTKVYAGWVINPYTLKFVTNGGTAVADVVKDFGSVVVLGDDWTTKTGYTFAGWFSDAELTDRVTEITLSEDKTVYAGWDINEYKVEFVTNGGTEVADVVKDFGTVVVLGDDWTTKTGYTFTGWFSDAELNDRVTEVTLSKDTTVYAGWDINEYKVEFVTNGGTAVADIVKDFGTVVELGDDWTTKTGYTFTGWFTDAELTDRVTEITLSEDKTVYAGWDINEYKVEFVTNGGSAVEAAEDVYGTVINLNDYVTTKTGYTFAGWFTDAELNDRVTEITLSEDMTVYAGWDINEYKVEFVTNGGTAVADIVKDFGTVVELGDDWTTKTGYTFAGWFTDAELNDRVTEVTLSKDTTVYAGWDINEYKVEFVTNGGSAVDAAEDVYGTVINLNDYVTTKTGYTFAGWYKDEDCTVRVTDLTLSENTTVYAGWVINPYTLKFVTNGGTAVADVVKDFGSVVVLGDDWTTKTGYTFTGWFTDAELTDRVTEVTLSKDTTVYAGWDINEYKVEFVTNGGSAVDTAEDVYGTVINLNDYVTTKTGYTFAGWYKDEDCTVRVTELTLAENTKVYAGWVINPYTLKFVTNGGTEVADVVKDFGTVVVLGDDWTTKTGYTFTGWFSDAELNDRVTEVTLSKDTTVYAGWDIIEYKVEFVTNGGSDVDAAEDVYGAVINLNDYVTTKTGYTFAGWYKDEDCTVRVTELTLAENTKVYAGWVINPYTLKFVTNGGTAVADVVKDFGTVVELGDDWTTKTGYTFTGWFTDAELTDRVTEITLSKDTTVYAGWDINEYKVEFVTNGGTDIPAISKKYESVIDLSDYTTTKTGFVFDGWYSDDAFEHSVSIITLTEDTVVYAKWIPKYTLTFETNGSDAIQSVTEIEGTVVDLTVYNPIRRGYTFKGWFTDADFENQVTEITLNSDVTVYAKWKKNSSGGGGPVSKYEITFDTNGGSKIEKLEKIENFEVNLSSYVPVKDGYVFDGWYTDAELTNKVTKVKMTNDITLYAGWKEVEKEEIDHKPSIMTDEHFAYIVGRDDGKVYPKANLTRAEAATIFFRLLKEDVRQEALVTDNQFVDVNEGHWFNTAVSTLANLDIVNGRTPNEFAPNEPITRAELTTIVARLSDAEYNGKSMFDDIDGHWAEEYINIAASIGWVEGDGNGLFRPDDKITRAEVMTLINRVLNRVPLSVEDMHEDMKKWPDNMDTDAWYYIAVQEATNSHDCEYEKGSIHEEWTGLTENPDWTTYEK